MAAVKKAKKRSSSLTRRLVRRKRVKYKSTYSRKKAAIAMSKRLKEQKSKRKV